MPLSVYALARYWCSLVWFCLPMHMMLPACYAKSGASLWISCRSAISLLRQFRF